MGRCQHAQHQVTTQGSCAGRNVVSFLDKSWKRGVPIHFPEGVQGGDGACSRLLCGRRAGPLPGIVQGGDGA